MKNSVKISRILSRRPNEVTYDQFFPSISQAIYASPPLCEGPGLHNLLAYRTLRRNAEVSFVETHASENFTGAALNINRTGNYEQYYVIRTPKIVDAYVRELKGRSTLRADHPVGNNPDR